MASVIVAKDELAHSGNAYTFEGYRYGGANVSLFLTDLRGPVRICTNTPTPRSSWCRRAISPSR
jgi:hypothetical protein